MNKNPEFAKADRLYDEGKYKKAFDEFLLLAESGDTASMSRVAIMYYQGIGIPICLSKSIAWDEKAAALGDFCAMSNLGCTYRSMGDIRKAKVWFEKALELGDGDAALSLAKMYLVSDKEIERVRSYLLQGLALELSDDAREEAQAIFAEIANVDISAD